MQEKPVLFQSPTWLASEKAREGVEAFFRVLSLKMYPPAFLGQDGPTSYNTLFPKLLLSRNLRESKERLEGIKRIVLEC